MESTTVDHKNIYYPPGGILLWIIIFLELFTFGMALIAMVYYGGLEADLFHESKLKLNVLFGTTNTIVLITSGFFMAKSVQYLKLNNILKSKQFLNYTMLFGLLFLIIKSVEYYFKIQAGLTMGYNTFFTFYWMLTLFHVIHVLIGLGILFVSSRGLSDMALEDYEAGATFWHMCDLIWLMVFPVIYLIF